MSELLVSDTEMNSDGKTDNNDYNLRDMLELIPETSYVIKCRDGIIEHKATA
jgi:hypothetical protein